MEKYLPTIQAIFQGLGVPPSLAGADPKYGYGSTFISLRAVVERLQYVRGVVAGFWEDELAIVQEALGFRHPFSVVFDEPALSDEAMEKKLLIDLMDRGVISDEAVLERFAADPEIEAIRVRRENRERKNGRRPAKASQFYLSSQQSDFLEREFARRGELTPSQVGLEYPPPAPGETPAALRPKTGPTNAGETPGGSAGRPLGSKDMNGRKQKRVVPLKAEARRRQCDQIVRVHFLNRVGKANARQLTALEAAQLEELCFAVLCELGSDDPVTEAVVVPLADASPQVPASVRAAYEAALEELEAAAGKASADDRRYLRGLAAAGLLTDPEEGESP
jgi:hypothetical protein